MGGKKATRKAHAEAPPSDLPPLPPSAVSARSATTSASRPPKESSRPSSRSSSSAGRAGESVFGEGGDRHSHRRGRTPSSDGGGGGEGSVSKRTVKRVVVVKKKRSSSLSKAGASQNASPSDAVATGGGSTVSSRTSSSSRPSRPRGSSLSRAAPTPNENAEDDPLAATVGSSASGRLSSSHNPTIPSAAARADAIKTAVNDINLDDICFKLVLIGDSGVGKSAVTFRFCDNVFFEEGAPTLGVDFKYARIETAEAVPRTARLQIWDTAGQEAFLTLTTGFYRSAAGVVLCFDLTSRMSFLHLDLWMQRIRDNCTGRSDGGIPPIILVGCKLDLARNDPFAFSCDAKEAKDRDSRLGHAKSSVFESEVRRARTTGDLPAGNTFCHRQVSQSEALAWCEANNILCYFETSAKENSFVADAFRHITTHIVRNTKMDSIAKGGTGKGSASGGIYFRPKAAGKGDEGEKPEKKRCAC